MESSSSSQVISPEEVLEQLMNDGTIDALRLKIINQLKSNEELKNTTIRMAEQSKVLNTPGAEKQTKRELLDALRQELETPVLEKASRSVWELILDNDGLGKEISETVERVYCRLSGRETPLFPLPSAEAQLNKKTEQKRLEEKDGESENQKKISNSSSKKRRHGEMNMARVADEVAVQGGKEFAVRSGDPPPRQETSCKSSLSISKA
ncbi:hypothetical protein K2173_004769 [Erythroxylum novogranatense]|uniref:Uncharacterized protein n=1 Tax=Erythroxylum novogranatense TaxID=1862640 RepID=A0AAV8SJL9_9ROSI|nr:hypothetical protein K2173_004769 [Erythroxylum novogranatense]